MNGLKYFSTIVAVSAKTINELWPGRTILILAILSSIVATVGNTYWDIVVDWGLLRRSSRNRWLRDELVIKNKSVYFIAMVIECVIFSYIFSLILCQCMTGERTFCAGGECCAAACLDAECDWFQTSPLAASNCIDCPCCLPGDHTPRHLEFLQVYSLRI